ncbi:uncharacterized protein LOC114245350 [Bombyx mandarina]|uniref:Uncharacterized protein LOC114245350 n=1 Tax=Bombyx mandarina TaxID=7092 RepID=A0A6J2JVB6_BOMMA|nr:uncharacterized protein LOC114245350 [Bombyx mandarina]
MVIDYEDDKNSMIALAEQENIHFYDDFYDEMDSRIKMENSMNMIFFGPVSSFMRIDAESLLHILTFTKKHLIPISRTILIWDLITDGKTAAFLYSREYLALGPLLNFVPEEDLYYVNFGDKSVLSFFANHNLGLHSRKYGVLAASYRRYYGDMWYEDSDYINELGYLICGFPAHIISKITPAVFKKIDVEIFKKLSLCSVNQTKTLYNLATHKNAYGKPYKWSSHEITKLDILFICVPKESISSIRLEAIPAISKHIMEMIHQDKLEYFTKQQILRMNPEARRMYIIRVQLRTSLDTSQIAKQDANAIKKSVLLALIYVFTLILK